MPTLNSSSNSIQVHRYDAMIPSNVLQKMNPKRHITRTTALWCGVALLALGVAVAAVAFYSQVQVRSSPHDAEAIAEELRANGAIVENYYKVIGRSNYLPSSPQSTPVRLGGYIAAGVLVAAGGILILKVPSFPSNQRSQNISQEAQSDRGE